MPSNDEWNALFEAVGGPSTAGKILKSISDWNDGGNGADTFGFSAFPSGEIMPNEDWTIEGYYAFFWSSTDANLRTDASAMSLRFDSDGVNLSGYGRDFWFSVRCVKD